MGKWARKIVQDFIFILTRIPNLGFNYILARISSLGFIYQKTRKISLGFMMEKAGRYIIPPCNHLPDIYTSNSSSSSPCMSVSSTNSSLGGM